MNDLSFSIEPDRRATFHDRNLRGIGRSWRAALIVIGVFFAVFGLWSIFAPLSNAAIAPGVVEVEGRRRAVQNLEGGIVADILVRDGQRVAAGQPLMRLDTIRSNAQSEAMRAELLALLAERQRLNDELGGGALAALPEELEQSLGDARTLGILDGERALLSSRRTALEAQRAVLRETASQARSTIGGVQAQIDADLEQLASLRTELASVETLVAEQLERRSRLNEVRRQISAVEGQIGARRGEIARARRQIGEADARMATLSADRGNENRARMREVDVALNDLRERMKAAADVDQRRVVTAPAAGHVVELQVSTVGAVVQPGERLLDIVPERQALTVAARVRPIDIENVHPGLQSEVRLVPYSGRDAPMLHGVVETVSADSITTDDGRETYYEVRVRITSAPSREMPMIAGMPAEVYVLLGERSLIETLLQPLTDSFRRALRE